MPSYEKKCLVNRWNHRRESLKALVAQAEAHREKEIYREWTLKEFLSHMSGWDDAVIEALRAHASVARTASVSPATCAPKRARKRLSSTMNGSSHW